MKVSNYLFGLPKFNPYNNNNTDSHPYISNNFAINRDTVSFGRFIDYGIPSTIAKELHPKVDAIHASMDVIKEFFAPYTDKKPLLGSKIKKMYPDVVQKRHAGITFHLPNTDDTIVIIKGKQPNLMWISIEDGSKFNGIILDGNDKLVANYSENHPHMLPRILKHMSAEKIEQIQPEKFINLAYEKMTAYAEFINKIKSGEIPLPHKPRGVRTDTSEKPALKKTKKIKVSKDLSMKKIKPKKVKAKDLVPKKPKVEKIKKSKDLSSVKLKSKKVKVVKPPKIKSVRVKQDKQTAKRQKVLNPQKPDTAKKSLAKEKTIKQVLSAETKLKAKSSENIKESASPSVKVIGMQKGFMTTKEHFDIFNDVLQTVIKNVSDLFRKPINEIPSHIMPKLGDKGQLLEFSVATPENGKLIVRKKSIATLDVKNLPYLSFEETQKNRLSEYTNIDLTTNEILRSLVNGRPMTTQHSRIFQANFNEVEIRKYTFRLKRYLDLIFNVNS